MLLVECVFFLRTWQLNVLTLDSDMFTLLNLCLLRLS